MGRVKLSLTGRQLVDYLVRQLNMYFPDGNEIRHDDIAPALPQALERLEHCFTRVANKYFFDETAAVFNHLHGDQYAIWLYLIANELYRQKASAAVCGKVFLLNKALHGCDIFYEVELPSIFLLVHPLGTVLGRGNYADHFVSYQRCSVGSNHDIYPDIGHHVTLRPGSAVLGNCRIGSHSQLAADSLVIDKDVPDNSLYLGRPGSAVIKPRQHIYPLWRSRREFSAGG
jgi:serine O-acetyltransferase